MFSYENQNFIYQNMKNTTILTLLLLASQAICAQTTPAEYPGAAFNRFSPDGNWAVSDAGDHAPLVIINFSTGEDFTYVEKYGVGAGNYISNTGVVVGYNMDTEYAAAWRNGNWEQLPHPAEALQSYAHGVSPDGSLIVGVISAPGYTGDFEGRMNVPCYWELNNDGSYSMPVVLPHPTTDFTNRAPQYVTALVVSEDKNTVAGQMIDFFGLTGQPVVYTRDDNGDWSYTLLIDELYHPEGIVLPPFPDDAPEPYEFMTDDELARYEAALQEWEENPGDQEDYPSVDKFMTPQEWQDFYEALLSWQEEYNEYDDALWTLMSMVPTMDFNNVVMTTDGKWYGTTDLKTYMDNDLLLPYSVTVPYLINIETREYRKFPAIDNIQLVVTSICDDGSLLAQYNDDLYGIFNGYILPADHNEFIPIYEFAKKVDPATAEWMEETMTHSYIRYDLTTGESYNETIVATGVPFATPDMQLMGFSQNNFWDYTGEYQFYGYLISLPVNAGVEEIAHSVAQLSARPAGNGNIVIKGEAAYLEIFSLHGMKMYSASNVSGIIDTGLQKGVYILKAKDLEGNNFDKKLFVY